MITDPFPTETTGVTRADIDHYAARLHDATHGPDCDCREQVHRQFRSYVSAIIVWLAADGRLS
ncbi:hypothetical protein [Micromonospora sp. ATCC 39149]|uniref:Uncharacterized protein n=1 Tax=Micromonospora carbonacea TaxID=47853 RepID=A0A7D6C6R7_9ACTN|nr:hypothetical protein [Micromonospora sp. ATCC 39149]QLJ98027.1 hypothetical protein HZU44_25345 [Micromonospora carbonacea]